MPGTGLYSNSPRRMRGYIITDLVIRDERHYLATVAEVRALTDRLEHVDDAKQLADRAAAAHVWARRARLGEEQVNLAIIAKLWAERRAGELLVEMPKHEGGRPLETGRPTRPVTTLEDLGVTKDQSSQWQKLAAVPAEDFQAAIDAAVEQGSVSRAKVMAVHYSSSTDLWSTPQDLFDQLNTEFAFTVDVCATVDNAKCKRFFTVEDDGLAQDWTGVCWMNPPYGDAIGKWVEKAHASGDAGATVVCLVPARVDTGWWWEHCRYGEVRFLKGRLKFGGGVNSAPFPSAVVVFGGRAKTVYWER